MYIDVQALQNTAQYSAVPIVTTTTWLYMYLLAAYSK